MYSSALVMMLLGTASIIYGATQHDGLEIGIGILIAGLGLAYTLFHRVIQRQSRDFHDRVSRMKRTYSNDDGND
jgi:hypothetical protein